MSRVASRTMAAARWAIFCAWLASRSLGLAGDFEFVVIGDTRPRFESASFRPFENLITRINELEPACIINLGDLIYGYGFPGKEAQWNKYESVIKRIKAPYFQVPGNHDTHSRAARAVYGRRFGRFFQSFDKQGCHFVLLDNTERQRWGYLGPTQLEWLRQDLQETRAESVFVFMHFPVWEPERITPQYHEFWVKTLHPLFRASRVKAVFAGHYHTYGPTREYDGIRYFITGGGGAELIPEYRKSGGQYHFMKLKMSGDEFDALVVTEAGELSDTEADVMGGLLFAARHVSRIGINRQDHNLKAGMTFNVSVANPESEPMVGEATWLFDASTFSIEPQTAAIEIPAGAARDYTFKLRAQKDETVLESLPRLQFRVTTGRRVRRFHREVRFVDQLTVPYRAKQSVLNGGVEHWANAAWVTLRTGPGWQARIAATWDTQKLHLAFRLPTVDTAESGELGFMDELQIGFARTRDKSDFGNSFLRLGFKSGSHEAWDRTAGHRVESPIPGVEMFRREEGSQKLIEVAVPFRLLAHSKALMENPLMLDVSYPVPEEEAGGSEPSVPPVNTFSYRVRYGSDSLVPVSFLQLKMEGRPERRR